MPTPFESDPDDPEPERQPADEVGDFAVACWEACESGDLDDRQVVNAMRRFVGRLHSYALAHDIKPPEAAILDLTEDAETAARDLLEAGLEANSSAKKPLNPHTIKRIRRILAYTIDPVQQEHIVVTSVGDASPAMSLQEVVRVVSAEDSLLAYTEALQSAQQHMGSTPS